MEASRGEGDPLAALARRLAGTASRRPGLAVGLWGDSGVGKSHAAARLLREARCPGFVVPAAAPDAALARALPPARREPAWAAGALGRLAQGECLEPAAVADAVAARLAVQAPVALLVEDAHEASPERREMLARLAGAVARSRGVALLLTGRPEPPPPFEAVRVEPLSPEGTARLLGAEAGGELPPEAALWVHGQAGGNALFALEFFRHLARSGFLWFDGRRWRWREPPAGLMPATVEALLARRLAGPFGGRARAVLEAAALLGGAGGEGTLAAVAGLPPGELEAGRRELAAAGLLAPGGALAHPLLAEVARRDLPAGRRRELAARAVAVLEETDPRAAAMFLGEAGLEPGQALALLERATEAARAAGDERGAARLLAGQITLAPLAERPRLALEAARAARESDPAEAERLADLALGLQPPSLEASEAGGVGLEAAFLKAELLADLGRGLEAERLVENLPEAVRAAVRKRWLRALVEVRHRRRDFGGVLELWEAHPALRERPEPERVRMVAHAMIRSQRFEEASALIGPALERPDLSPFERAALLNTAGIGAMYRRAHAETLPYYDAALAALEAVAAPDRATRVLEGMVRHNRALALRNLRRLPEAVADLERGLARLEEVGDGERVAEFQASLGDFLYDAGRFERAESVLLEARDRLSRHEPTAHLVRVEGNLAMLYLAWGGPHHAALALRHAGAGLGVARQLGPSLYFGRALAAAAEAEARHGSPQAALALIAELEALPAQVRTAHSEANARWVAGLALERFGRRGEALEALREGVARMRERKPFARDEEMALELDRLAGDEESARARLAYFESVGFVPGAQLARRYFPGLGETGSGAPPAPGPLPSAGPAVRLEVLGPLRLTLNGAALPLKASKGKALLARLLEARLEGKAGVPALELTDALYREEDEEAARGSLKNLVLRLRAALGPGAVLTAGGGYALGAVASDAEGFLSGGDTGLWRGPYLGGEDGGETGAAEALHTALRERAARLPPGPETARLGRLLLEADPYDKDALRLALAGLRAGGNRKGVLALYAQARERFAEVGERLPEDWRELR